MFSKIIAQIACGLGLLVLTTSTAAAAELGSRLPLLGDFATAGRLVALGNASLNSGDLISAKTDFKKAMSSSPFYPQAYLGLARCATDEGDYKTAIENYSHVDNQSGFDVDFITEVMFVYQKAGDITDAVLYFNRALDLSKRGYGASKMEMFPPDFQTDGSDYNANEMSAVADVIRGLYAGDDQSAVISSERTAALATDPGSPIVRYYDSYLLKKAKAAESEEARDALWRNLRASHNGGGVP